MPRRFRRSSYIPWWADDELRELTARSILGQVEWGGGAGAGNGGNGGRVGRRFRAGRNRAALNGIGGRLGGRGGNGGYDPRDSDSD